MLPVPQPVQPSPSLIPPIPLTLSLPHTLRSPCVSSSTAEKANPSSTITSTTMNNKESKATVTSPAIIPVPLLTVIRDNAQAKSQPLSSESSSSEYSSSSSSSSTSESSESPSELSSPLVSLSNNNTPSLVNKNWIDLEEHKEEVTREYPVLLQQPPSLSLSLPHAKETPLLPPFIPQIPVFTNNVCSDGIGLGKAIEGNKLPEECKPNVTVTITPPPSQINESESIQTGALSSQSQSLKNIQTSSSSSSEQEELLLPPPLSSLSSLSPNSNLHTNALAIPLPLPFSIESNSSTYGVVTQPLNATTTTSTPKVIANSVISCPNVEVAKRENDNLNETSAPTIKIASATAAMNVVPVEEASMQSSNLLIFGGARYNTDKNTYLSTGNEKNNNDKSRTTKNFNCRVCKRCDWHKLQHKCTRLSHELNNVSALLSASNKENNISNKTLNKPITESSHVSCSSFAESTHTSNEQHLVAPERDDSDNANSANKGCESDFSLNSNIDHNNNINEMKNDIELHQQSTDKVNAEEEQQLQQEQESKEENLPNLPSECSTAHPTINVNETHLEADKKNNLCTIAFFGTPSELHKALASMEEKFDENNQCRYWKERLECEQQGYVKFERREWGIKRNVGAKTSGDNSISGNNKSSCNYTIGFGKRATPLQFAAIAKKLANVILLLLHGAKDDDEPTLQQILSTDEYALIVKLIERININASAMIKSTYKCSENSTGDVVCK